MTVGVPETNLNSWGITYDVKKVQYNIGVEPEKPKKKKRKRQKYSEETQAIRRKIHELDQEKERKESKYQEEKDKKLSAAYDKIDAEKKQEKGGQWREQPSPTKYTGQDAPAMSTGRGLPDKHTWDKITAGKEKPKKFDLSHPKFQKDPEPAKPDEKTIHKPSGEKEGTTRAIPKVDRTVVDTSTDAGKRRHEDRKVTRHMVREAEKKLARQHNKKRKKIKEGQEAGAYREVVSDKETRERAPVPILGAKDEEARQAKLQAQRDSYARQGKKLQGVRDSWRKTAVRGLPKRAIVQPDETDEGESKKITPTLQELGRTKEIKEKASFDKIQNICNQILKVHYNIGVEGAKNLEAARGEKPEGKAQETLPRKTTSTLTGTSGSFTSGEETKGRRKAPKPHIPFKAQDIKSGKVEDVPDKDVKVSDSSNRQIGDRGVHVTGNQARAHVVGSKGKKFLEEKRNPDKPKVDLKQLKQLRDRVTSPNATEADRNKLRDYEESTHSHARQEQDASLGVKGKKRFSHNTGQDKAPTREEYNETVAGQKNPRLTDEQMAKEREVIDAKRLEDSKVYNYGKKIQGKKAKEEWKKMTNEQKLAKIKERTTTPSKSNPSSTRDQRNEAQRKRRAKKKVKKAWEVWLNKKREPLGQSHAEQSTLARQHPSADANVTAKRVREGAGKGTPAARIPLSVTNNPESGRGVSGIVEGEDFIYNHTGTRGRGGKKIRHNPKFSQGKPPTGRRGQGQRASYRKTTGEDLRTTVADPTKLKGRGGAREASFLSDDEKGRRMALRLENAARGNKRHPAQEYQTTSDKTPPVGRGEAHMINPKGVIQTTARGRGMNPEDRPRQHKQASYTILKAKLLKVRLNL